jgi:multidrug efflux pump subunit AcrA (membrane-fusion protein)
MGFLRRFFLRGVRPPKMVASMDSSQTGDAEWTLRSARLRRAGRRLGMGIAALALLSALLVLIPYPLHIVAPVQVRAIVRVPVTVPSEARVLERLKEEGDAVAQDVPLLRISAGGADTVLHSPLAGVVVHLPEQTDGKIFAAGATLAEVADLSTLRADLFVSEAEVMDVALGQPVTLRVRTLPHRLFHGQVETIAAAVQERPDGSRVVRVSTTLKNPDGVLRENTAGYARVEAPKRALGAVLFAPLVRWFKLRWAL